MKQYEKKNQTILGHESQSFWKHLAQKVPALSYSRILARVFGFSFRSWPEFCGWPACSHASPSSGAGNRSHSRKPRTFRWGMFPAKQNKNEKLDCEYNWVNSMHDMHGITWECGELKLYFLFRPIRRMKKKKKKEQQQPK